MDSILPAETGLDINGLIYRYTTNKNTGDDMKVHVGNRNSDGTGYTFRETDDWSGLPSNTITKSFDLPNVPATAWGDGFIEVEGQGSVENPVVIYSFRLDLCADPQSDPSCAGYVKPMPIIEANLDIYNPLEDEALEDALDTDLEYEYPEGEEVDGDEEGDDEESRIEKGLAAAENALTLASGQNQTALLDQLNASTDLAMYYNSAINGGIYTDSTELLDANLPDNAKALRNNLAQQLLHEEMIQQQYE